MTRPSHHTFESAWEYDVGDGAGNGSAAEGGGGVGGAGRHAGPMAQDFRAAFGLGGGGGTAIDAVDADGVALAAIQARRPAAARNAWRAHAAAQQLRGDTHTNTQTCARARARVHPLLLVLSVPLEVFYASQPSVPPLPRPRPHHRNASRPRTLRACLVAFKTQCALHLPSPCAPPHAPRNARGNTHHLALLSGRVCDDRPRAQVPAASLSTFPFPARPHSCSRLFYYPSLHRAHKAWLSRGTFGQWCAPSAGAWVAGMRPVADWHTEYARFADRRGSLRCRRS